MKQIIRWLVRLYVREWSRWKCRNIPLGVAIITVTIGVNSGCRLGTPDFEPPWDGNTNTVTLTNTSRTWMSGLSLHFPQPPSAETRKLLDEAGAVSSPVNVFAIARYDRFNEAQNAALEAAMREGAIVTGR